MPSPPCLLSLILPRPSPRSRRSSSTRSRSPWTRTSRDSPSSSLCVSPPLSSHQQISKVEADSWTLLGCRWLGSTCYGLCHIGIRSVPTAFSSRWTSPEVLLSLSPLFIWHSCDHPHLVQASTPQLPRPPRSSPCPFGLSVSRSSTASTCLTRHLSSVPCPSSFFFSCRSLTSPIPLFVQLPSLRDCPWQLPPRSSLDSPAHIVQDHVEVRPVLRRWVRLFARDGRAEREEELSEAWNGVLGCRLWVVLSFSLALVRVRSVDAR